MYRNPVTSEYILDFKKCPIEGSIYKDDCKIQPNIPLYLIVAGALGTLQHFIAIWTKYLPKESQGRLKNYRSGCLVIDSLLYLFLTIWFVLGTSTLYSPQKVY
ncbi:uncharacterized protein TNCV_1880111 [Trichonephila clavipes]|nr:uncharacterized protein TNCV_1880111 [Trichonephila clavipes]